ncbi:MAG: SRPBCC domain-containing protein [Deltaproteobacteria bacterium]|nr:SRPBCC domain-containing protein [Deltaproteobacteria bacterium]MBK8237365.1 SRPBCC domain-containing protein [Deltaproteobacteria bacterium]MBK8720368.1 SRPBCC domain-containing protein [Deltaproteobacteria bacterium]MBP7285490.1 SRPBCC domain-containing protein [Nannocystaceae bacterium]
MTTPPGDAARVSVVVRVARDEAFRIFTEEIDSWWRHGLKYRVARGRSVMALEPGVGGRLFERIGDGPDAKVIATGEVLEWAPPARLVLRWRAVNFAPAEWTTVEIDFEELDDTTRVRLVHRGWHAIRPDHPARHRQAVPVFIRSLGLWWGEQLSALRERVAVS